jgi:hypothetical protein
MRLEFHPDAELELIESAVYYEKQVPGLGERFESEIRYATDLLLDQPEIGSLADPNLRKFILNRFPSLCTTASQLMFYALRLSHTKAVVQAIGSRGLIAR